MQNRRTDAAREGGRAGGTAGGGGGPRDDVRVVVHAEAPDAAALEAMVGDLDAAALCADPSPWAVECAEGDDAASSAAARALVDAMLNAIGRALVGGRRVLVDRRPSGAAPGGVARLDLVFDSSDLAGALAGVAGLVRRHPAVSVHLSAWTASPDEGRLVGEWLWGPAWARPSAWPPRFGDRDTDDANNADRSNDLT